MVSTPALSDPAVVLGVLSAPTNLGLRPPEPSAVPGTAKAPEALREAGFHSTLAARRRVVDAGAVLPGRYLDDMTGRSDRVRNQDGILDHAHRLAERVSSLLDGGSAPVVLGGDCSVLLGIGIALRRAGRFGLVHVDGHTDFRHPTNSPTIGALAGEDLAAVTGRHLAALADPDGLGPLFAPEDTIHVGCRDDDEHLPEVRAHVAATIPASTVVSDGPATVHSAAERLLRAGVDGLWVHVDVDVLDPSVMPAVDSPSPAGLSVQHLAEVLDGLASVAAGIDVCVFDPDLDPDGRLAVDLATLLVHVLSAARGTADMPARAV